MQSHSILHMIMQINKFSNVIHKYFLLQSYIWHEQIFSNTFQRQDKRQK